jgi:ABC-type transport system involved in multi-copper enzyme maturation permease subunit
MRLARIARKEIMDAVRGRQAHLLVALFGLLGAVLAFLAGDSVGRDLTSLMVFLVPLAAVALTQHAIVGKRERGELTVLLGLPFSRRDVVAGAYLGRVGLVAAAVASAYAGAILVGILSGASADPGAIGSGIIILLVVGAVFVSVVLAISAVVKNSTTASAGAFVTYLGLVLPAWQNVPDAVLYVTNGFESPETVPEPATVFDQFAPFIALRNAATPLAADLVSGLSPVPGPVPANPPIYMQPWFGAAVLIGWIVVPVALGYRRFERSDL